MFFRRLQIFGWIVCCLLCAASFSYGQTQVPAQIAQPIDNSVRTTLAGSVHPSVKKATDLGALSANESLARMLLVLKPSDAQQAALRVLIENQQTRSSPLYHKWLTAPQFSAQFGPAASDVQKIAGWLQQQGFTEIKPAAGGQWIEFSGNVGTVESAFQTSMHRYQVPAATGTEEHIANASQISIPQAIAPVVKGVVSLNNFFSKPMHTPIQSAKRNASGKFERVKGDTTTTDGNGNFAYYLAPGDVQTIYGASPLIASGVDGTGVSIAVIGRSDIELSDVQTFRTLFQLPQNDPNFIVSGPDPGLTLSNDQVESSLDVEWAAAVAPKATVNFVAAASTDTTDGISLAAAYAVENVVSPILSLSYGECEANLGPAGNQFWNAVWEQAAAEGISVFVSSGDSGAASCDGDAHTSGGPAIYGDTVSGTASTPYNVAVGGTQFAEGSLAGAYWNSNNNADFSSALGYIPEAAWNESCDPNLPSDNGNCLYGQTNYNIEGGGGGASSCSQGTVDPNGNVTCTGGYAKPSWQSATGVPTDGVRDLPDVSLNASPDDDPYIICVLGFCQYSTVGGTTTFSSVGLIGGTSASAPTMASIMALVEQKNGQYLGQPNYTLYKLAAAPGAASCNSSTRTDPSQGSSCVFNDITSGNNSAPGLPGYGTSKADFTTTTGYDLATGLGTVNVAKLVANWSTVSYAGSSTQLTTGATTAKHGQPIQVTVKVSGNSGSSGTPSGDIALSTDHYGAEGQYTLTSNGSWSGSISDLPGGTYNLIARYAGDAIYGSSASTSVALTIAPEDSKPSLVVDVVNQNGNLVPFTTSQILGTMVYFKAAVVAASGQGVPTGAINILDGTTVVATGTLNAAGTALLSSNSLTVGTHALTVSYTGDNSFNAATSAKTSITIGKGQTVTYPYAVGIPVVGQPTLLAVTVSSSSATAPTGTVQIFDNGAAISKSLPIVLTGPSGDGASQVSFTYTFSTPSQNGQGHTLTASYTGDKNYDAVAQNDPNFAYQIPIYVGTATGAATTTTFKMTSAPTIQMGQIATFLVSVAPSKTSSQVPTGIVFILGNGSIIGSANLTNGKGYGTTYMDDAGTWQLSAEYTGDSNFQPSSTPIIGTLTVPKATPAVSFTTTSPYVLAGTQTSLNFTATGIQINPWVQQDPNGTVTFTDSANGGATQSLGTYYLNQENGLSGGFSTRAALPAGTNVLTATYSGNENFNPTTSTLTVVVGSPDFIFNATPTSLQVAAGSSGSISLNLSPVLGFTGNVALSCASGVPAGATCSINPSSLTLGSGQTATVTLATLAPSPTPTTSSANSSRFWKFSGGISLAGLLLVMVPRRRRAQLFLLLAAAALTTGIGCGGSGSPKATLLALTSSNTKVATGSAVTFTATLDALESAPTGSITFYDGSTAIASNVAISQGAAVFQISSLLVGGHVIKAVYTGDKHDQTSSSSTLTQVITGSINLQVSATSGSLTHTVTVPVTLN